MAASSPTNQASLDAAGDIAPDDIPAWVDAVAERARRVTDAFEVRAELKRNRKVVLDDGNLNAVNVSRVAGVSLKVYHEGASGFASTHDTSPRALDALVERAQSLAAANAARHGADFSFAPGRAENVTYTPDVKKHPAEHDPEAAIELLKRAFDSARDADSTARIAALFGAQDRRVVFADAGGRHLDASSLISTLFVHAVHKGGTRLADGHAWESGERGLGDFERDGGAEAIGLQATQNAIEAARAEQAPAGRMRVLCDNHLTGLLAHESFGHLTEFDLVTMGWSILGGREGQTFAGPNVSIVDAPEVPGAPHTGVRVPFDDEGTAGRAMRILDKGVLRGFLHQRGSAADSHTAATGNGRALTVRHPSIVRMRNTFIEPGSLSMDEALEELGDGVYLIGGRGGAPASDGSFMFTATRGYRVHNGRIENPIRSTSISGNVLDFLRNVEGLTRDFKVPSTYFGGCGKWDQGLLHVGMGGPHTLVSSALVGGEAV